MWLIENLGTIIVGLILLSIVTLIIIHLLLRKKAGKCLGCDACDGCNSLSCMQNTTKQNIEVQNKNSRNSAPPKNKSIRFRQKGFKK